jgi:hypothetical protein
MIRRTQYEDGLALGEDQVRVGTAGAGGLVGEIAHRAVATFLQPALESGEVGRRHRQRNTDQGEPQAMCFVLNGKGKRFVQEAYFTRILT